MLFRFYFQEVRIIFNIPEDYPDPRLLTNLITDIFSKYRHVKVVINNNSKESKQKQEMELKIKMLLTKYEYIFKKGNRNKR